jgi:hypothetical protein
MSRGRYGAEDTGWAGPNNGYMHGLIQFRVGFLIRSSISSEGANTKGILQNTAVILEFTDERLAGLYEAETV